MKLNSLSPLVILIIIQTDMKNLRGLKKGLN